MRDAILHRAPQNPEWADVDAGCRLGVAVPRVLISSDKA